MSQRQLKLWEQQVEILPRLNRLFNMVQKRQRPLMPLLLPLLLLVRESLDGS
ncbi:MAG: hypothetical protein PVS3B1_36670 [Ktedonobacteraceae bacterium]